MVKECVHVHRGRGSYENAWDGGNIPRAKQRAQLTKAAQQSGGGRRLLICEQFQQSLDTEKPLPTTAPPS